LLYGDGDTSGTYSYLLSALSSFIISATGRTRRVGPFFAFDPSHVVLAIEARQRIEERLGFRFGIERGGDVSGARRSDCGPSGNSTTWTRAQDRAGRARARADRVTIEGIPAPTNIAVPVLTFAVWWGIFFIGLTRWRRQRDQ
jgi:hypothetical protein